jgi:hypothetical protein
VNQTLAAAERIKKHLETQANTKNNYFSVHAIISVELQLSVPLFSFLISQFDPPETITSETSFVPIFQLPIELFPGFHFNLKQFLEPLSAAELVCPQHQRRAK